MANPARILDSHVHFWAPDLLRYAWLGELPAINQAFGPADYCAAKADLAIEGMIFVQADCAPEQGLAEVDWVLSLGEPRLAGLVAFAPLERGNEARGYLEELMRRPLIKGVRRLIQGEPVGFGYAPGLIEGVRLLPEFGLSFDLCLKHHQLAEAIDLVAACPATAFVLDHLGKPDIKAGSQNSWRAEVARLAIFPNVVCKICGLATEADWRAWQAEDLQAYFEHVLGCFGAERLLFGSDWPVVNLAGGYQRWFAAVEKFLAEQDAETREAFFWQNAQRVYRLA